MDNKPTYELTVLTLPYFAWLRIHLNDHLIAVVFADDKQLKQLLEYYKIFRDRSEGDEWYLFYTGWFMSEHRRRKLFDCYYKYVEKRKKEKEQGSA
jgi:hypothetical protein